MDTMSADDPIPCVVDAFQSFKSVLIAVWPVCNDELKPLVDRSLGWLLAQGEVVKGTCIITFAPRNHVYTNTLGETSPHTTFPVPCG